MKQKTNLYLGFVMSGFLIATVMCSRQGVMKWEDVESRKSEGHRKKDLS